MDSGAGSEGWLWSPWMDSAEGEKRDLSPAQSGKELKANSLKQSPPSFYV